MQIHGGRQLKGVVKASGSKNAILPILAASIMLEGETTLKNISNLGDVKIMVRMLNSLGVRTEYLFDDDVHILNNKKIKHIAPYELVTAMRASFFVAGPILARTGYAKIPMPGGCTIGTRPVDIHLQGFEALGAQISIEHGFVQFKAKKLKGTYFKLPFPSVGATENLMMAACLAEGETILDNVAKEPEIEDVGDFLIQAGAKIQGLGTQKITITGVQSLSGIQDYHVIPDRIEVATLLVAGAITNGNVTVTHAKKDHLQAFLDQLKLMGFRIEATENSISLCSNGCFEGVDLMTAPYPGFPTDLQAQMMSLLTVSTGKSVIQEAIFENRFMHVNELVRMGAKIQIENDKAIVFGVNSLSGADVKASDLRAGAALVCAGLAANGKTVIYDTHHITRGYYNLIQKLQTLGANIR